MKYFKPELLARYRSSDDRVAEAAATEWEEALAAYQARFKSIRGKLPVGVRRFSKVSLHDARYLGAALDKQQPLYGLLLQLEGLPGQSAEVLELKYQPVPGPNGGIHIMMHTSSERKPRKGVWLLYDEFDLDEAQDFFTHTLLLTGGWEIEIRFLNFSIRRLTPTELAEGKVTWPSAESVA